MTDVSIPILLAVIGMLIVVLALAVVARQLVVSRPRGASQSSLHRRSLLGRASGQRGVRGVGTGRLRWFRAFSMRLRPEVVLRRSEIREVSRRRLAAQLPEGEDCYLVTFELQGGRTLEAIVDLPSGAALNAWLEAAPTGLVRGDAD